MLNSSDRRYIAIWRGRSNLCAAVAFAASVVAVAIHAYWLFIPAGLCAGMALWGRSVVRRMERAN